MKNFAMKVAASATAIFLCLNLWLPAQPVISEYVEGSFLNKCIEILNPGPGNIDLGQYGYRAYHNGAVVPTFQFSFPTTTLAPGQVYVICNPSAAIACSGSANLTNSSVLFNGDDAIALYDTTTGNNVDIFGSIGQDPGSRWTGPCGHRTKDRTLRRKFTAVTGVTGSSTGFPTLCTNWNEFPMNACDNLGVAPLEINLPNCNPIISQYVEGTGNCKFIEIYNPCCDTLNLADYEINIFFNACTATNTISLSGLVPNNELAPGGVVVLYNPFESCSDFPVSGGYPNNFFPSNLLQFNGNDAVALTFSSLATNLDIFGNICENVVWSDTICGASSQNQSLIRKGTICEGVSVNPTSGFPTLCTEWDTLGLNSLNDLGQHSSECLESCGNVAGKQSLVNKAAPQVVVFPNPFSETTTFQFTPSQDGPMTLAIFNLHGKQVAMPFAGTVKGGQPQSVNFAAGSLSDGVYVYQLKSQSEVQTGKIVLRK